MRIDTQDLNRSISIDDIRSLNSSRSVQRLKAILNEYRTAGLPIVNGSFRYSTVCEGSMAAHSELPYRLWEYASLLDRLSTKPLRILDVGGAGSLLPYALAEEGHDVTTIDQQGFLVALCEAVAKLRRLPLQAYVADLRHWETTTKFDVVACVSVLEHLDAQGQAGLFRTARRTITDHGLLYVTFDYGRFAETDIYTDNTRPHLSVRSVDELVQVARACDFAPLGTAAEDAQSAPAWREITWRAATTLGAVDAATPWRTIFGYALRRAVGPRSMSRSRYREHTFYRMFFHPVTVS